MHSFCGKLIKNKKTAVTLSIIFYWYISTESFGILIECLSWHIITETFVKASIFENINHI